MYSQATVFRLPSDIRQRLTGLSAGAEECRLKPVGPLELASSGFVSPFGEHDGPLIHQSGECILLAIGREERVLPRGAIDAALKVKLDELEKQEGRVPGARTRKRLKDEVITDMLPRAFTKRSRTDAYIDLERSLLVVTSGTRKTAEAVASEIRRALGSFPAVPVNPERSPIHVLTQWIEASDHLPTGLAYGDECVLKCPAGGDTARLQKHDLASHEVANHLEAGKQCHRIGVVYDERVGAVIDEKLVLRKVKLLDVALEQLDGERESLRDEIDARFVLFTGEFGRLLDSLFEAMQVTKPQPAEVDPLARAA